MKAFFVALSLIVLVNAHGWLNVPEPAGYVGNTDGSASQTSPCGKDGVLGTPKVVKNYGQLEISFTIGGGHDGTKGTSECKFSLARVQNNTEFEKNVIFTQSNCRAGNYAKNITVFYDDLADVEETLYFQFFWYAGDGGKWWGCSSIVVQPSDVVINSFTAGNQVNGNLNGQEVDYYRSDVSANKNLFITASAPATGTATVMAKSGTIPSNGNYDSSLMLSAGETYGFSLCGDSNTAQPVFITYSGNDNDTTGSYSFSTGEYNSMINFLDAKPQVTDSLPSSGSKFYYTLAFSTEEKPKRIVVSTEGSLNVKQSTKCTPSTTYDVTGSGTLCTKLGTQNTKKFIEVNGGAGTSYTVSVEDGKCEELDSSSIRMGLSMVVLAIAAFVNLF